ncbi:hypothetical protein VHEMI00264 [[Torrubiella] hemipterigena]|uniref:Polysaccharide lyase family 8 protein n=1 Tax=[Torrubiella] hemipterigena TaxID=1531966 RepID=A0A0A1T410_9HYPO|nr:hypothetical protein VHEMI00264 [[Torrubiella] hemipterigena]
MKFAIVTGLLAALLPLTHASPAVPRDASDDLALITQRRTQDLAQFLDPSVYSNIDTWVASQKDDGTWSDVNYLSGCAAQRANWPIQQHWNRLIALSVAWSGVNLEVSTQWKGDAKVMAAISKGLDYWFNNDYKQADCVGDGGDPNKGCPCGTPGLWNTNWYGQTILIPQLCSITCLVLKNANLTESQRDGCIRIPKRSYDLRDSTYGTGGRLTGANVVLVMQNSVSLGLFMDNATIVQDSLTRAMNIMTYTDEPALDGIHRDGTFLQHDGVLYNGNYGKDLLNAFIQLGAEIVGTQFATNNATKQTMATYVRGCEWMIFTNQETRQEYWDFNAVGRFVAFPTQDLQAISDINFNVTKLAKATADFTGLDDVSDVIRRLSSNGTDKLVGNKGFWASDYMVHRRDTFILGNKMVSTRTVNSENVNGANPLGYHLGQGTLFSYVEGNEYKDIMGAWDWNLVPGTTTLLNQPDLHNLPPTKNVTGLVDYIKHNGTREFVGVVSNGKIGVAAHDYSDPLNIGISYRKAWFHFEDAVVVVTSDIVNKGSAPVITVLDNRAKAAGGAFIDGDRTQLSASTKTKASTLFYGGNGYVSYDTPFDLTISEGPRDGNWSAISTSKAGKYTTDIFSAYTTITGSNSTYAFFPATSKRRLAAEHEKKTWQPIVEKGITGAMGKDELGLVFWPGGDDTVNLDMKDIGWSETGTVEITSDQPLAYLITGKCKKKGEGFTLSIYFADPTQKLKTAKFTVTTKDHKMKNADRKQSDVKVADNETSTTFTVDLPQGGLLGSTVTRKVYVAEN